MAIVRIGDVIQPTVFTDYVTQQTMVVSNVLNSGIATNDSEFDALASGPNTTINMPYFNDLTGDSEVMSDTGALTPGNIGTNKDVARKQGRARAWGANGLSALLSGADPMNSIGNLVTNYWARDRQKVLLSTLSGIFASASMASKVLNISAGTDGAALIDGVSFIDATQLMGDAKDSLTAVVMHSAVEAYLAKKQLIEYVQDANQSVRVPYFMGKRVIVDDAMPFNTTTKVATMYLFGEGALAWGNGSHPNIIETEVDRDSLASTGEDFLINRNIFILHPRGVKFTDTAVVGNFPTNAELATGTNWSLVYEPKAVRMVKFDFKIA